MYKITIGRHTRESDMASSINRTDVGVFSFCLKNINRTRIFPKIVNIPMIGNTIERTGICC
jgi:hypothetical protein